jgi:hypothetical protein
LPPNFHQGGERPHREAGDEGNLDEYSALNRYISTARDNRRGSRPVRRSVSSQSSGATKPSWIPPAALPPNFHQGFFVENGERPHREAGDEGNLDEYSALNRYISTARDNSAIVVASAHTALEPNDMSKDNGMTGMTESEQILCKERFTIFLFFYFPHSFLSLSTNPLRFLLFDPPVIHYKTVLPSLISFFSFSQKEKL